MNAAEQAILDHAPVGSLWRHRFTPDAPLLACTGLHDNWRDPAEWAADVQAEPVVWLGRADDEGNPTGFDRGTVSLGELREGYERVHLEETANRTLDNREKRRAKIERVKTDAAQMLLDGLEVDSISELKRLVDYARRDGWPSSGDPALLLTDDEANDLWLYFEREDAPPWWEQGVPLQALHGRLKSYVRTQTFQGA